MVWRWALAVLAVALILAGSGLGLWFGGGPDTRDGWEAAAWGAGITCALALTVSVVGWAVRGREPPETPEERRAPPEGGTSNVVNGDVSDSATIIQADRIKGPISTTSYGGDHVDLSGGTFHGPVTGKRSGSRDDDSGPGREGRA